MLPNIVYTTHTTETLGQLVALEVDVSEHTQLRLKFSHPCHFDTFRKRFKISFSFIVYLLILLRANQHNILSEVYILPMSIFSFSFLYLFTCLYINLIIFSIFIVCYILYYTRTVLVLNKIYFTQLVFRYMEMLDEDHMIE